MANASDWQYTDSTQAVVTRTLPTGQQESCLATVDEVQAWVADGNTIVPAPTPA